MDRRSATDLTHGLLRIAAGFMYWSHGAQKFMGWFGGFGPDGRAPLTNEFGVAGIIEFFGGLLVTVGLFARPVAFIISGEMAVTYFWKHVPGNGFWPWLNRGEVPALYAFIFLFIAIAGAGALSLDRLRRRRSGQADAE